MSRFAAKILKPALLFLAGLIFAVVAFIGINIAMVPVSTPQFCASKCHEMDIAYQTWELSPHGANKYGFRVECVDCHLPPEDKFFTRLAAKGFAGVKDTYKHNFGPAYDGEVTRQKVIDHIPSERCLHCHDDLLGKPFSPGARSAHQDVLADPDKPENRCVQCHENTGHERNNKLYSQYRR